MEEDHKTKETRDEGVEKHSCQIELRGAHLNLVYYNGKQVLCTYIMVHVTVAVGDLTSLVIRRESVYYCLDHSPLVLVSNLRFL